MEIINTYKEIVSDSCWNQIKSDFIYHSPIDCDPNRFPFGSKSIWKKYLQSGFGWFNMNKQFIFLYVGAFARGVETPT